MYRKAFALLAAAALSAAATSAAATDNDHRGHKARLVGVWNIKAQPVNCETRAPLPVPMITGIVAFHSGGTSTEAGPSATPRTPGLGTWYRTGKRTFSGAAHVINFDTAGLVTSTLVVRREITVAEDQQSFAADTRTTITDASGVSTLRCADATATRAAE